MTFLILIFWLRIEMAKVLKWPAWESNIFVYPKCFHKFSGVPFGRLSVVVTSYSPVQSDWK